MFVHFVLRTSYCEPLIIQRCDPFVETETSCRSVSVNLHKTDMGFAKLMKPNNCNTVLLLKLYRNDGALLTNYVEILQST